MKAKANARPGLRRYRQEFPRIPIPHIYKKLPNEPILSRPSAAKADCHFRQVSVNEPFAKTHNPIFPPPNRSCAPLPTTDYELLTGTKSDSIRPNPTKKRMIFLNFAVQPPIRAQTSHPIFRQNLTGQTALLPRLYAPVLRGIRAFANALEKEIDVYWNLYSDCYPV